MMNALRPLGLALLAIAVVGAILVPTCVDGVPARAFFGWLLDRDIGSSKELAKMDASRVIGWTSDQWQAALADYAVATAGGPPEEEP